MYQIAEKQLTTDATNGLVDLCIDWALAYGASIENILDVLRFRSDLSFPAVRAPKQLTDRLKEDPLHLFDRHLSVVQGVSGDADVGPQVAISVDKDRLAPVCVRDTNGLGRYAHRAIRSSVLMAVREDAQKYVKDFAKLKDRDVKPEMLFSAFYRVCGLLTIQTFGHLDHLALELLYEGNVQRAVLNSTLGFDENRSLPWVLGETRGVLTFLHDLIVSTSTTPMQKVMALTYLADLPVNVILGACQEADAAARQRQVVEAGRNVLRHFKKIMAASRGIRAAVADRRLLPRNFDPTQEWPRLCQQFPSLDWQRRLSAADVLLREVAAASLAERWEPRISPPPMWRRAAQRLLKRPM